MFFFSIPHKFCLPASFIICKKSILFCLGSFLNRFLQTEFIISDSVNDTFLLVNLPSGISLKIFIAYEPNKYFVTVAKYVYYRELNKFFSSAVDSFRNMVVTCCLICQPEGKSKLLPELLVQLSKFQGH